MLILKLTVVPLFIAAVTLAGRRWGAGVAGLLGGFPIVAGPIVIFIALEQGVQFGALAATAAISAIAGLLVFERHYVVIFGDGVDVRLFAGQISWWFQH